MSLLWMQPSNEGMETTQTDRQMGHNTVACVHDLSKVANVSIFSNLLTLIGHFQRPFFFFLPL